MTGGQKNKTLESFAMTRQLFILTVFLAVTVLTGFGQTTSTLTDSVCSIDSTSLNHCSCDSFIIISPKIKLEEKDKGVFDGKCSCWTAKLYTADKKISACGFYSNYKLTYGLKFIYSTDGKLTKVEQYYSGQLIRECKLEDKQ